MRQSGISFNKPYYFSLTSVINIRKADVMWILCKQLARSKVPQLLALQYLNPFTKPTQLIARLA